MSQLNDLDSLVERYWRILKLPHDETTKDFLRQCQSHTVRANGKPYKYFEQGRGPAVLFVHGLHSNLGSMVPIAASLLERGHRVVLFDAPAHGEALGSSTNPLEAGELIRAICGQVGELHAIVGHSLGGLFALSAWNENVRAKAFVSISTPSNHRFLVDKFAEMHVVDAELMQELSLEIEKLLGAGVWTAYSPSEIVKTIDVPGLIVHGTRDDFVPPEHASELHAHWRGSTLEMLEGVGHFDILASPAVRTIVAAYLSEAK